MKRLLLLTVGVSALLGATVLARADDPPIAIFMEPETGLLAAIPGAEDAAVIINSTTIGLGEAHVEATQSLVGNVVTVEGGESAIDFTGGGNDLSGVLSINQEAGNMNQQANIRSIVVVDAGGGPAVLHLDINTSQELTGNSLVLHDTGPRSVSITDSFNNGTGIVGINQSAGNLNQQLSVVAIGLGFNAGSTVIQLGDAQLGQIGTDADNSHSEDGVQGPRTNTLSNSFNDFHGIAQISQTTGDMNRVTQSIGISVTTPGAP
ncbi:MAG: hypothetical protein R3D05_03995 [Dongiaceae bacterium]